MENNWDAKMPSVWLNNNLIANNCINITSSTEKTTELTFNKSNSFFCLLKTDKESAEVYII